jgi:hypothetical protein
MVFSASAPQNAAKLLHLHLYKTTVVYKCYDADCEVKVNFVEWYLQMLYAGEMKDILALFCDEAEFHLSGYLTNRHCSALNPVLIPGMQYIIVCGVL